MTWPVAPRPAGLVVIGNITLDHEIHPDGQHTPISVGGAALRVAMAAAGAGLPAAPVSVVGDDLRDLPRIHVVGGLDLFVEDQCGSRSVTWERSRVHPGETEHSHHR